MRKIRTSRPRHPSWTLPVEPFAFELPFQLLPLELAPLELSVDIAPFKLAPFKLAALELAPLQQLLESWASCGSAM